jgi:response regulator RpfG family c-di-GMP phosphodiesterase
LTPRILLVDGAPQALSAYERELASDYRVAIALGRDEALELCETAGPFAALVCDCAMPDASACELLARVHQSSPETVGILLAGCLELDRALAALRVAKPFAVLEKPCPAAELREVIEAALVEHGERVAMKKLRHELSFSSQVLARFNDRLDERVLDQARALARLHRFTVELNSCDSLQEICALAAAAAREECGGRSALVELWSSAQPSPRRERCRSAAGGPFSARRHVQPIETQEGQIGSLVVDTEDERGRALSRGERCLLGSIASSTAVAAFNQIRRRERDAAQQATILALARLAEKRDNETGKHLERVSRFCELIAEGLREDGWHQELLGPSFVRDLVRSAPLHDIGKVGIPDAILLKPGKLTQDEWRVMKTHTELGAETLRSVIAQNPGQSFLEMSLDIAWCHHEKWDGSGYPRGLSGESIPLSARILALADVYDALTSLRPYKEPWSHADSLAWILTGSGTHFDPRVVQAFARREERAHAIREQLADTPEDLAGLFHGRLALAG